MEENITENDWRVFRDEWRRYRRSCLSQDLPQVVADQLKSCCSKALRRSIFSQSRLRGLFNNNTNEETLLKAIREVAVKNIPKNVNDFLGMNQLPQESIENYAARLTNASMSCNFDQPHPSTNYREQMIKHQLIKGLEDNEVRIQTIQTISKKQHVSLGETLYVIKTKESANKEVVRSKAKIKSEYIEAPDTTQIDIEMETTKAESDNHDQSPSPTNSSAPMIVSPPNRITNQDDLDNKNLLLPPQSPTPSTVSTNPFSPCHSQEIPEHLVGQIREENVGLNGRVNILEESLAEQLDMIRRMKEKHQNEIGVLELQLKLKSEAVERMISVAQKDSRKYAKQINNLQEKRKDCELNSESSKKDMLLAQEALKQMKEERTKAQHALTEVLAEKEKLQATLQNNQEYQRHKQQEHNEEMEKMNAMSKRMQTKLDKSAEKNNVLKGKLDNADIEIRNLEENNDHIEEQLSNANCKIRDLEETNENIEEQLSNANCEIRYLEENNENIKQRSNELEEKNEHLKTVNKNLEKRVVPIQKSNSHKRKIQEPVKKVVTKKRKIVVDEDGNRTVRWQPDSATSETSSDDDR